MNGLAPGHASNGKSHDSLVTKHIGKRAASRVFSVVEAGLDTIQPITDHGKNQQPESESKVGAGKETESNAEGNRGKGERVGTNPQTQEEKSDRGEQALADLLPGAKHSLFFFAIDATEFLPEFLHDLPHIEIVCHILPVSCYS